MCVLLVKNNEQFVLLIVGLVFLGLSSIHPRDRFTRVLEVPPILLGVPILFATFPRFRLTPLVYRLLKGRASFLWFLPGKLLCCYN